MGTINNAFILGHLGADPTAYDNGTAVAELCIATNRRIDADDKTTFRPPGTR